MCVCVDQRRPPPSARRMLRIGAKPRGVSISGTTSKIHGSPAGEAASRSWSYSSLNCVEELGRRVLFFFEQMDSPFGLRDQRGAEFLETFMDDCSISTVLEEKGRNKTSAT